MTFDRRLQAIDVVDELRLHQLGCTAGDLQFTGRHLQVDSRRLRAIEIDRLLLAFGFTGRFATACGGEKRYGQPGKLDHRHASSWGGLPDPITATGASDRGTRPRTSAVSFSTWRDAAPVANSQR